MDTIKSIIKAIINFIFHHEQREKPLKNVLIMIDPGHGLYETMRDGSIKYLYQRGCYDGIIEDEITIKLSKELIPLLKKNGAKVITTRAYNKESNGITSESRWKEGTLLYCEEEKIIPNEIDVAIGTTNINKDINIRWQLANHINRKTPIDLFLSIHFNAGGGNGCEVFYHENNKKMKKLAKIMVDETVYNNPGLTNRGAKPSTTYSVLTRTSMPSLLWEGAFFDSDYDRNTFLRDKAFYRRSAEGITDSIVRFYGKYKV